MKLSKKDLITYLIIFLFVVILFVPWIIGHYATDTYKIVDIGYKEAARLSLNDGRAFMSLIGISASTLNVPIQVYVTVLLILALAISVLIILVLKDILIKYAKEDTKMMGIIATIISFVTIFNFMYIENLYFAECFVMSLSILMYLLAAKIIVYKKNLSLAAIFTVIGMLCYQGTIGVLFTMSFLFSILENREINKEVIKNFILCIVFSAISILFNFILIKIVGNIFSLQQSRIGNNGIINNIYVIITYLDVILIGCCEMFPKYLLIIYVAIIALLIYIYKLKYNEKYNMGAFGLLILITIGSSFIPYIISLGAFWAARLKFTIGALIGIVYMYIYCNTNIFNKKTIYRNIFMVLLIAYLIINLFNYQSLMYQHKLVNKIEKEEGLFIKQKIQEYETTNNIDIEKIAIVRVINNSNKVFYEKLLNKSTITYNAIKSEWSSRAAVNFYTERKLTSYIISEEQYKDILNEADLNDDNIVFIDDTIYLKIYMY